jgi:predicted transcriptional regulator
MAYKWTEKEDAVLYEMYNAGDLAAMQVKVKEVSGHERSFSAIKSRANKLGLHMRRTWANEEIEILKANYGQIALEDLSERIAEVSGMKRSPDSIVNKANELGLYYPNRWTPEEIECLETWYGNTPIHFLAKRVSKIKGYTRTEYAVKEKLVRMGLTNSKHESGKLSARELADLIGTTGHRVARWIKSGLLKGEKRATFKTKKIWLVKPEDFWHFAEENKDLLDFSKIEPFSIIPEPEWVEQARKESFYKYPKKTYNRWTPDEDKLIEQYHKQGKNDDEIAQLLKRTPSAVRCRIEVLMNRGLIPKKLILIRWREVEVQMMYELEKQGFTDAQIAEELGRTTDQIESKRRRLKLKGEYEGIKNKRWTRKNA